MRGGRQLAPERHRASCRGRPYQAQDLKVPLKGPLGGLNIGVSDLFHPKGTPGIEVSGTDIFFDTLKLLPPPHIHGQLTKVRVVTPDIEEVYGNAEEAVTRFEQWRNF